MKFLVLLIIILFTSILSTNAGEIRGRVVDVNNNGIPNVNLILLKTKYGTSSDLEGNFSLVNVPAAKYKLQVSAIGFETKVIEVDLTKSTSLNLKISLNEIPIEISSVEVSATREQSLEDTRTSVVNLKPRSVKILPGAAEDVLRTIQALPGVVAINDFSSQLVIRGSGPDQNLIVLDDVEIFNPYRLYGAISMFNPETVSEINLITGGFSAKYGDRLSAVLDVSTRDGDSKKIMTGNLNVNVSNMNIVLEGKNPLGLTGSWIFNSRRTYYDLILEPIVRKAELIKGDFSFPNFYDFQFKMVVYPALGHKLFFTGIHSRDAVELVTNGTRVTPDSLGILDNSFNDVYSLSYQITTGKISNKLILSYYKNMGETNFDSKFLDPTLNREEFEGEISDTVYQFLLNFSFNSLYDFNKYSIADKLLYVDDNFNFEFGTGVDIMRTEIKFNLNLDQQLRAILNSFSGFRTIQDRFRSRLDYWRAHSYGQGTFSLSSEKNFFVTTGVRLDYYDILKKSYLSPRFGLSYLINDITTIRFVYGIYYQSPGYEKLRDQNSLLDFSKSISGNLNAERSTHFVLGIDRYLSPYWQLKSEVYYKKFNDLIVPKKVKGTQFVTSQIPGTDPKFASSWTQPVAIVADSATSIPVNGSEGESYGWEILITKKPSSVSRFDGWISYSLSFSTREELGRRIPFRFDQRHTLNFVLNYKISEKWDLGVRWQYGSGLPYTSPVGIKPRILIKDLDGNGTPETPEIATRFSLNPNAPKEVIFNVDYGLDPDFYNSRKPDYHRLDLRISYYTTLFGLNSLFYLDIINVYNRKNVVGYDYYIDSNLQLKRRETYQLPIFPTIGMSIRF